MESVKLKDRYVTVKKMVIYGKDQTWTSYRRVLGSIGRNNGEFGDPLSGTKNECRCITLL